MNCAVTLSQKQINRLYNIAYCVANDIRWFSYGRSAMKQTVYNRLKHHLVDKYYNLRSSCRCTTCRFSTEGRDRIFEKLFDKSSVINFGVHLNGDMAMLDKILDRVIEDVSNNKEASWVDINSSIQKMEKYTDELEKINGESKSVYSDLAKIPQFIESGKWE